MLMVRIKILSGLNYMCIEKSNVTEEKQMENHVQTMQELF